MKLNDCIYCPEKPILKNDGTPLYVCKKAKISCPNKTKYCEWYKKETKI